MFGMANKIFQANQQNQWLNIEPLQPAIRAVTRLPMITIGMVSPMTRSLTLVDKKTSSITEPPVLVADAMS